MRKKRHDSVKTFIAADDVASELGISAEHVKQMAIGGAIRGVYYENGTWMIPTSSLKRLGVQFKKEIQIIKDDLDKVMKKARRLFGDEHALGRKTK